MQADTAFVASLSFLFLILISRLCHHTQHCNAWQTPLLVSPFCFLNVVRLWSTGSFIGIQYCYGYNTRWFTIPSQLGAWSFYQDVQQSMLGSWPEGIFNTKGLRAV